MRVDKQSYYGFKVGKRVILNETYNGEYLVDKGEEFTILSFPCFVMSNFKRHQYFVYGKTSSGKDVRVEITSIIKIRG